MASATACTWPWARERTHLERLSKRHEGLALQRAADDVDQRIGQMRQIAQRLVLDLAVFAVAAAQQVGGVDLVLVDATRGDDVSSACTGWHEVKDRFWSGFC
jgi:hypothetical protein